jgi:hypothetical protein
MSTVIVFLDIEGEPAEALTAVRKVLEAGVIQRAIEMHRCDAGGVRVAGASARGDRRRSLG